MTDPGLRFWLRHVEASGGLSEPDGDSVLVVLPAELSGQHDLPEELLVTDDPDVARSDGVMFLGTGHPVLAEAAEARLSAGDAGITLLDRPAGVLPSAEIIQEHARAQLAVGHGRIDVSGALEISRHWIARIGVMVCYAMSAEDHFTERVERWVHVAGGNEVQPSVVTRLTHAPVLENSPAAGYTGRIPLDELSRAVGNADAAVEAEAIRRRAELSRELGGARDAECARAETYYADAIAGIERRMATAAPDRQALLADRLASTREERARRLAEIAEKYQPHHEIKPFRLHLVGVPALRVPVEVRRGERRYPIVLDWLLPAGVFASPVCPSCRIVAPLVAGKNSLGCLRCLTPKATPPQVSKAAPPQVSKPVPPQVSKAAPPRVSKAATDSAAPVAAPTPPAKTSRAGKVPAQAARAAGTAEKEKRIAPAKQTVRPARQTVPSYKRIDDLLRSFWNAAATRRSARLGNLLAGGSPASVLHALYGADCVPVALGIPLYEELVSFGGEHCRTSEEAGFTRGTVATELQEHKYTLRWREEHRLATVTEIISAPIYPDGRLHAYYWWQETDNPLRITKFPEPRQPLDEVGQLLLADGGTWHGLAVVARALAAWSRLGDNRSQLLTGWEPAVVAAGVHRLAAFHSGDRGLFRGVAEAYRVPELELRRADAKLRKLLDFRTGLPG